MHSLNKTPWHRPHERSAVSLILSRNFSSSMDQPSQISRNAFNYPPDEKTRVEAPPHSHHVRSCLRYWARNAAIRVIGRNIVVQYVYVARMTDVTSYVGVNLLA